MSHKAGFVNIIGRPNVGKSTLMNAMVGERLSIITSKAQTTRHRIMGIVSGEDFQIVYSDTPGLIKPNYKLHESMMKFVDDALQDADVFLYVVEAGETTYDEKIVEKLNNTNKPILLLINKIDKSNQEEIDARFELWKNVFPQAVIIPISAKEKFNVDVVFNQLLKLIPESPAYYPKEDLTNRSMRFLISEIVREKILLLYKKEIPYSCEVVVDAFKEDEKIVRIYTTIFVSRETQKMILIGHHGKAIKELGISARKEIETFLDKHVHLELSVKVNKDWRDNEAQLKRFGYDL